MAASAGSAGPRHSPARRRRPWPRAAAWLAAALTVLCAVTARVFVWPASGMPAHVDAIVMLAGPGARLPLALRLGREHRAPFLVVSRGFHGYGGPCPAPLPHVRLICFQPDPPTTRGEAEFAASLAARHHWHSIALVTSTVQDSRARLRLERCFPGTVYVVTVGLPLSSWPVELAYEWAATVKSLAWERSC
jgi:uncharacterized SAM-binding protein YcdF (DUF218 family)